MGEMIIEDKFTLQVSWRLCVNNFFLVVVVGSGPKPQLNYCGGLCVNATSSIYMKLDVGPRNSKRPSVTSKLHFKCFGQIRGLVVREHQDVPRKMCYFVYMVEHKTNKLHILWIYYKLLKFLRACSHVINTSPCNPLLSKYMGLSTNTCFHTFSFSSF